MLRRHHGHPCGHVWALALWVLEVLCAGCWTRGCCSFFMCPAGLAPACSACLKFCPAASSLHPLQLLVPDGGLPTGQRAPRHHHAGLAQPAVPAVPHRAGAHPGGQPHQPQRPPLPRLPRAGAAPRRLTRARPVEKQRRGLVAALPAACVSPGCHKLAPDALCSSMQRHPLLPGQM